MPFVDDATPVDPTYFDGAVWLEASMYEFRGRWEIPAAPVHKAFDDINAAVSDLAAFVETQRKEEVFHTASLMVQILASRRDDLEADVRGEFSRKAHRTAGANFPEVQIYPYGASVETAPRVLRTSCKSLNEILVHDRIEELFESLNLLVQCGERCMSKIEPLTAQDDFSRRIHALIEGCDALEEGLRGPFSRRARRRRQQGSLQ